MMSNKDKIEQFLLLNDKRISLTDLYYNLLFKIKNIDYKDFDNIPTIYIIINKLNNKQYIGSTNNPFYRIKKHIDSTTNKELNKDIKIYGTNNFDIELNINPNNYRQLEHYLIDLYNNNDINLYNIANELYIDDKPKKLKQTKEIKLLDKSKIIYNSEISKLDSNHLFFE